ncbi:MAG: hypothetical protein QM723_06655 [Myxococcaceae bacterium]
MNKGEKARKAIVEAFGDYRAEWRPDLFTELFIRPPYFDELEAPRPSVLVGGRGTGKTTALKSLQAAAARLRIETFNKKPDAQLPYLGTYLRINKNRSAAFYGSSLDRQTWDKLFAHYFNLNICLEFARLWGWLITNEGWSQPDTGTLERLTTPLTLDKCESLTTLTTRLKHALDVLEVFVNNASTQKQPTLSMAESPVRAFIEVLKEDPRWSNRPFYCCIDEYENLSDREQEIANTYIKHSEFPLCFKVGVRRFGLRSRQTSTQGDLLATPDDFAMIDIAESEFSAFAIEVANMRLTRAVRRGAPLPKDISELLPGLSRKDEAALLGGQRIADAVILELKRQAPEFADQVAQQGIDAYFVRFWQEATKAPLSEVAKESVSEGDEWATRVGNYGYASLFWISKGHKGQRIRKYYCGVDTFLGLASGNIRYFLELVHESIARHLEDSKEPTVRFIEPAAQSVAARDVSKRRLDQLEGLGERSIEIKRLVLALGRVFFEYARAPEGHAPEVNSFVLEGTEEAKSRVLEILKDGVSHLAFEVAPRTKPTSPVELKDEEFRLHPIFSAYFEFSYRRKRRTQFSAEDLLLVMSNPRKAVRELLKGRPVTDEADLPTQLDIFSTFYGGGKDA